MARESKARKGSGKSKRTRAQVPPVRRAWRWFMRRLALVVAVPFVLLFVLVLLFSFLDPPTTHTIWSEKRRLGDIDRQWIGIEEVAPSAVRAVVAAEDANYCLHWGFDVDAIRDALEDGGNRGASTISQQTVKNVFLWQGRSWFRKALEALITPVAEAVWSKRRMLEIYLNVAEFDEGVFGIDAAAYHYFGVPPKQLTPMQGALLAGVLPNPKNRSASRPTGNQRKRAARIADGAATIAADGRAACFED
ncbi:monofunctional biosynthetic peptidoglycan transglycosylase [Oceanicola sp. 502str15]|uniref:monofunctional biosynthetic peptidoglycan transglycosylase n=1 Tax=Oceanicola sp. 502str15 TaxID=2696061 RepID=UPI002094DC88|nr:monofunctional biosynthetic peptidoglycan transglycosylase [Oceanicola sp. 502str15]MCO6384270.1 monofunctional biosynthetic peptidoglycan transglycosylase [Oceanicola sp. 502str15]